jgi:hypothetical protein
MIQMRLFNTIGVMLLPQGPAEVVVAVTNVVTVHQITIPQIWEEKPTHHQNMKQRLAGQILAVVLVVGLVWMMWKVCKWVVLLMQEGRGSLLGYQTGSVLLQRPNHGERIQEKENDQILVAPFKVWKSKLWSRMFSPLIIPNKNELASTQQDNFGPCHWSHLSCGLCEYFIPFSFFIPGYHHCFKVSFPYKYHHNNYQGVHF